VTVRIAIPVLSVGAYFASLAAPSEYQGWLGIHLFLMGLLYFWGLPMTLSWWANVLYVIALRYYCRRDQVLAMKWAVAATGLATTWVWLNPREIHAPAFLLWSGAMATLAAGSLVLVKWPHQSRCGGTGVAVPPHSLSVQTGHGTYRTSGAGFGS
jgi:hypothetical protein